jgi:hypothetical protein
MGFEMWNLWRIGHKCGTFSHTSRNSSSGAEFGSKPHGGNGLQLREPGIY